MINKIQQFIQSKFQKQRLKYILIGAVTVLAFAFALTDKEEPVNVDLHTVNNEYTDSDNEPETQFTDLIAYDTTESLSSETQEEDETEATKEAYTNETITESTVSRFEVHYIDVGQADSALVLCDDAAMLIDGGNSSDSDLIYTYLKEQDVTTLDYVVATHPHEDHIGGLSGALNFAAAEHVLCSYSQYDSSEFETFQKYAEKQGVSIEVPAAGDFFALGSATVEILACNSGSDENNNSIVLKITYGENSFLFTGDAEREAEQAIIDAGFDLSSTVLKVGHHGSSDSTSYVFLREIMPQYAVISVGEGNEYGHPTDEVLSRLRDAEVKTYRTDLQGHVICISDGTNITFYVEKNMDADTLALSKQTAESVEVPESIPSTTPITEPIPESAQEPSGSEKGVYAVNDRNGKIHITGDCPATRDGENAMKNPVYFPSYEEAEAYSKTVDAVLEKRKCGNCW